MFENTEFLKFEMIGNNLSISFVRFNEDATSGTAAENSNVLNFKT